MVWPHGDPAALGLMFPASSMSQTEASRQLQSVLCYLGNLNTTQQMLKSNEKQSAQTHLERLEKSFFWHDNLNNIRFKFDCFVAARNMFTKNRSIAYKINNFVWGFFFKNLYINCHKSQSSFRWATPSLISSKMIWHINNQLLISENANINNT